MTEPPITTASLFCGMGGFDLAASKFGVETKPLSCGENPEQSAGRIKLNKKTGRLMEWPALKSKWDT